MNAITGVSRSKNGLQEETLVVVCQTSLYILVQIHVKFCIMANYKIQGFVFISFTVKMIFEVVYK